MQENMLEDSVTGSTWFMMDLVTIILELTNIFVTAPRNSFAILCFISDSEVSLHNGQVNHDVHWPVYHLAALLECLTVWVQDRVKTPIEHSC